jgi:hypothetical protein
MKAAAAFSIGLWTGAAVIAAVGLFYVQGSGRVRVGAGSAVDSKLAAQAEQVRLLAQENARLNAEVQRLRETASTLKSNLAEQPAEQPTVVESRRRIPFRRVTEETEASPPPADNWIEQAVAGGDATALPQLEKLALKNDHQALEALALLADQDQAAALTRVWRSGSLTLANQVDATRYLAATMEVNPDAESLLRGLAADTNSDVRALYAAVDGIANPNFHVSFGRDGVATASPRIKPDYAERIRLLEGLRSSFTNEDLRAYIDQMKAEAIARWADSNPVGP